jgi:hypothetical protein
MTRALLAVGLVVSVVGPVVVPATPAVAKVDDAPRIILDTDLSKWWDDATAVGIANVLQQRGKVQVLGVVSDVPNRLAVAAIDAIDTAYGHDRIPVGAVAGSAGDTFDHGYTDAVVSKLPHSLDDSAQAPEAVALYRRLLASQPDHSVTIVSVGGYTNLAGLLQSKRGEGSPLDGHALIARKTKRLVIMDGFFPNGGPAFTNQKLDLAGATAVVSGRGWPVPVAWVDGFNGIQTKVGATLCTSTPADHPMRIVYEALFGCGPPTDGNWDAPALLYAVGDSPKVFTELGQGGGAVINDRGGLSWQEHSSRAHDVYVHPSDQAGLNQRIEALLAAR